MSEGKKRTTHSADFKAKVRIPVIVTAHSGVDPGGEPATATLDGRVASDLEWARSSRNESIIALNACIAAYDAVKAASDSSAP